jgi:hypothetical protein
MELPLGKSGPQGPDERARRGWRCSRLDCPGTGDPRFPARTLAWAHSQDGRLDSQQNSCASRCKHKYTDDHTLQANDQLSIIQVF